MNILPTRVSDISILAKHRLSKGFNHIERTLADYVQRLKFSTLKAKVANADRMRVPKMAELQFEAPLASFENEEWNEYNEFQTAKATDDLNSNMDGLKSVNIGVPGENNTHENFGETVSGSLEDLVNTFDDKITKCFCTFEEQVDTSKFAPVQIRTQEEVIKDCQMWWTITGNFGNILPIDWSKTYTRQLHTRVLNLEEEREPDDLNLDLSDDEELAQAFDMHSLIVSSLQPDDSDHVASADEVISEIDTMMQEPNLDDVPMLCGEMIEDDNYTKLKETLSNLPNYPESELKEMSTAQLHEVLAEYELTIKELNETLVLELALRDEREYDKELKNQFISLLLTIQKKRREGNVDKKKKKSKPLNHMNMNNNNLSPEAGAYLTTVIPYHQYQGPPSSEQLQIYIKILQAINEDSVTVPTLLTDYILKVLCPT
ncbi:fasciculation and elongation protein zeta-2-like [Gigantopelta aegis]|uniref:fasciculation and elongation protein zeta-2-like n=1 Tax=Gigantopelta aegis TaxID=1735272 RepID=UPI001B88C8DE|nr:fasciculation and elongation protein zeta-2-like [Gigantopelta aegis]